MTLTQIELPHAAALDLIRLAIAKERGVKAKSKYVFRMDGQNDSSLDSAWAGRFYPDSVGAPLAVTLGLHILLDTVRRAAGSVGSDMAGGTHITAELALSLNDAKSVKQDAGGRFAGVHSKAEAIARPAIIFQARRAMKKGKSGGARFHENAVNFAGGVKPQLKYFAASFEQDDAFGMPIIYVNLYIPDTHYGAQRDKAHELSKLGNTYAFRTDTGEMRDDDGM